LTEANALNDMRNQNRIILGGPRPWINKVKQVFEAAFLNVPIVKTSSSTAEMVKYVTNVHSCFCKDVSALISIAKTLGIDPKVMNGAWHKNMEVRPQRDWEKLVRLTISKKREI
jgi:UDP-glucose 6-dehydrogenase